MVWIVSVVVGVILFNRILLFGLYNLFNFRIIMWSICHFDYVVPSIARVSVVSLPWTPE